MKAAWDSNLDLMVALQDIAADEPLIVIPPKFMLSIDSVAASPHAVCLDKEHSGLNNAECVVLFFMSELSRPDSFWKPYFDILPR